jgi:O-antigen/teichoic acid export membrane protein
VRWLRDGVATLGRATHFDRAVGFAVAVRVWQIAAAPITLLLIARYLSPELQGFYYTFASLLALQSFVELGFFNVIINAASHQWSQLHLDASGAIAGDPAARSRLISLGRLVFKWYAMATAVFVIGVGGIGLAFFGRHPAEGVAWEGPWLAVVFFTGVLLWALPFNSFLEGCNQVETIQRLRLSQSVLSSFVLWGGLVWGVGLWALVLAGVLNVSRDAWVLLVRYRRFFRPFLTAPEGPRLRWRDDIWPLQWRIGLSGVVNYFAFSLFNPVMFHYHGTVVAGQMGMTLAAVFGIQAVGLAVFYPKVPRFGMLVSRQEFPALDQLWLRATIVSLVVCASGAIAGVIALKVLNDAGWPLADRLLQPGPAAMLLGGMLLMHLSACQTGYLRAHREEPIVALSVTSSIATGLAVWLLGSRFGPMGAAAGYLAVAAFTVAWETQIWFSCRARWHAPALSA